MSSVTIASFYACAVSAVLIWQRLACDIDEIVRRDNQEHAALWSHLGTRATHRGITVGLDVACWYQRGRPNFTRWMLAKVESKAQHRSIAVRAKARIRILLAFTMVTALNGLCLFG